MRLARLAALGLAIGVIAGFAIALLRPRPSTSSTLWNESNGSAGEPAAVEPVTVEPAGAEPAGDHLWDQFREAEQVTAAEPRSSRRVKG